VVCQNKPAGLKETNKNIFMEIFRPVILTRLNFISFDGRAKENCYWKTVVTRF
jgi:hypothetical protein